MNQTNTPGVVLVLGDTPEAVRVTEELLRLGYAVHWVATHGASSDGASLPYPEGWLRLTTYVDGSLLALDGHVGKFEAQVFSEGKQVSLSAAALVVATGNERYYPGERYAIELSPRVLSLTQMQGQLQAPRSTGPALAHRNERILILLDHGGESSKETAGETLQMALRIRQEWHAEVYVFYQNMQVDGSGLEQLTREMRDKGVVFCRYAAPKLVLDDEGVELSYVEGSVRGEILVLPEATRPQADTPQLAALLKVRVGEDGYFQDVNIRQYRPGLSVRRGIFFAGRCHMDADAHDLETDALQAAANVDALLGSGALAPEAMIAHVDAEKCIRCLTCIRTCPHAAVELADDGEVVAAQVVDLACWGCGACVANCPVRAINMVGQALPTWIAQLSAETN
jgi:heterodisulfide reductase subunit A-like polyferredoxin